VAADWILPGLPVDADWTLHAWADWSLLGLPVDVDWTLHAYADRSHAAAWACDELTPGQAAAVCWAGWWMQRHCYAALRSKPGAPDWLDLQMQCCWVAERSHKQARGCTLEKVVSQIDS